MLHAIAALTTQLYTSLLSMMYIDIYAGEDISLQSSTNLSQLLSLLLLQLEVPFAAVFISLRRLLPPCLPQFTAHTYTMSTNHCTNIRNTAAHDHQVFVTGSTQSQWRAQQARAYLQRGTGQLSFVQRLA